jgi:hypothetical protein
MAHENQSMFSISKKQRKSTKAKIEHENNLIQEWLNNGNKIKVFTRDFNDEDYQLGHVKHRGTSDTSTSDKG